MMRSLGMLLPIVLLFTACAPSEDQGQKLQSSTYWLYRANYNPISGEVTVRELEPGKLEFSIELQNTSEGNSHPAHLHFGSVREVGELAFALNPVDGATGKSVTVLDKVSMSNGEILTYDRFLEMDGSVKIHMNDTFFKHMVLAFGNVGKNEDYFFDGVAVCTGH